MPDLLTNNRTVAAADFADSAASGKMLLMLLILLMILDTLLWIVFDSGAECKCWQNTFDDRGRYMRPYKGGISSSLDVALAARI